MSVKGGKRRASVNFAVSRVAKFIIPRKNNLNSTKILKKHKI